MKTVDVQSDPFGGFFDPFGFFGNPGQGNGGTRKQQVQTPKREATGSGVIISADGYIVTNNHVVEGADELTVTLNDNREYSARIIGTDKSTDLALIKIDGKNLPTLPIANSDNVKVGEWVIAVGNPYVDKNNIGIWGWSYGGFNTLILIAELYIEQLLLFREWIVEVVGKVVALWLAKLRVG